jgi:hypothetical protein
LINVARRIRTNKTSTFKPPESNGNQIAADTGCFMPIGDTEGVLGTKGSRQGFDQGEQ